MTKNTKFTLIIYTTITIIIIILLALSGCATRVIPTPLPATVATTALAKLVGQNWLILAGAILCMTGVYTAINGGTKGISLIGAGLAGLAVAGIWAAFIATIADYRGWVLAGLIGLIVVGFGVFLVSAADINQDGRVNWQDIRDLFKKK